MQRLGRHIFVVLSILLSGILSCVSHNLPEYTCAEEYTFAGHVRPIIQTKCAVPGCHNGDMGADLNWTVFEEFEKRAISGQVKRRVTGRIMPPADSPAGPLTQDQIDAIACWADQGARNN